MIFSIITFYFQNTVNIKLTYNNYENKQKEKFANVRND